MNQEKINYLLENWKTGVHLVFRTKRFGVNNKWWSSFDSIWGKSLGRILLDVVMIKPIVDNYKSMRTRATYLHFMSNEEKKLMDWDKLPQW
jgi:hypothetical protein